MPVPRRIMDGGKVRLSVGKARHRRSGGRISSAPSVPIDRITYKHTTHANDAAKQPVKSFVMDPMPASFARSSPTPTTLYSRHLCLFYSSSSFENKAIFLVLQVKIDCSQPASQPPASSFDTDFENRFHFKD